MISYSLPITRWWFQISFIFTPTCGNDAICLFFFSDGWLNHQLISLLCSRINNWGVANREFFYILREMTKLQIYGCGGAPSGGWSGSLDFFVIKFQDAGVGKSFFLEHFSGRWRSFFFVWTWRWFFSFILTKSSDFWLELELCFRNSTGGLGMAWAQVLLVVGCWLVVVVTLRWVFQIWRIPSGHIVAQLRNDQDLQQYLSKANLGETTGWWVGGCI